MNMTSILTRALILVAFGAGVSIAIANRVERTHTPVIATATTKTASIKTTAPAAAVVRASDHLRASDDEGIGRRHE